VLTASDGFDLEAHEAKLMLCGDGNSRHRTTTIASAKPSNSVD